MNVYNKRNRIRVQYKPAIHKVVAPHMSLKIERDEHYDVSRECNIQKQNGRFAAV